MAFLVHCRYTSHCKTNCLGLANNQINILSLFFTEKGCYYTSRLILITFFFKCSWWKYSIHLVIFPLRQYESEYRVSTSDDTLEIEVCLEFPLQCCVSSKNKIIIINTIQQAVKVETLKIFPLPHEAAEWRGPAFGQHLHPLHVHLTVTRAINSCKSNLQAVECHRKSMFMDLEWITKCWNCHVPF